MPKSADQQSGPQKIPWAEHWCTPGSLITAPLDAGFCPKAQCSCRLGGYTQIQTNIYSYMTRSFDRPGPPGAALGRAVGGRFGRAGLSARPIGRSFVPAPGQGSRPMAGASAIVGLRSPAVFLCPARPRSGTSGRPRGRAVCSGSRRLRPVPRRAMGRFASCRTDRCKITGGAAY